MKLNVPEVLKVLLVDDWEAITKNNQARLSLIGYMRLPHSLGVSGPHSWCVANVAGPASSGAKCDRNPPRVQRTCREIG